MQSVNGRQRTAVHADKSPERTGWELLAWAILEQAVDDLVLFCRYGIITTAGKCLPWPYKMKPITRYRSNGKLATYWQREPRNIAWSKGPNDHKELRAWFLSEHAEAYCHLIGCKLPAREIFWSTVKNHGGLCK